MCNRECGRIKQEIASLLHVESFESKMHPKLVEGEGEQLLLLWTKSAESICIICAGGRSTVTHECSKALSLMRTCGACMTMSIYFG